MAYDSHNVFSKILRKEIPCQPFYEDDFVLSFSDLNPLAPVHLLIIPKNNYISFDGFSEKASSEDLAGFFSAIGKIAKKANVSQSGYRLITNHGEDAHQEVPHFHVHLLAGKPLGSILES